MKRIKSYENQPVTCYLIATPIGNLGDISTRAKDVLNSVNYIACEDTRTTYTLLSNYGITNKTLIAYHEHIEQECSAKLISLLKEGNSLAIVSDAGYPGISDPGAIMVKHCIENDIAVSVIPGACALLPALIGSGLDTTHFYFHGFLSSKPSLRRKELEGLKNIPVTIIFYESPHRIKETLNDIYNVFGQREISLSREITKLHEEYIHGTTAELAALDDELKGEMVLIVEGAKEETNQLSDENLIALVKKEIEKGTSTKDACKLIAEKYNSKKNYLYNLIINKQS